jgi:NTP pyrophosphatase (non-canonical NTP hydrolase)
MTPKMGVVAALSTKIPQAFRPFATRISTYTAANYHASNDLALDKAEVQPYTLLMKRRKDNEAQIFLFPSGAPPESSVATPPSLRDKTQASRVSPHGYGRAVLSGTFRRDLSGLREAFEELHDIGCEILSPHRIDITREENGFVYMRGEETSSPQAIENRHLEAIEQADFMWLHAPEGYVGLSASLEIGFASAMSVPIFAKERPADPVIADFVHIVSSIREIPPSVTSPRLSSRLVLSSLQEYYRRIAAQRGFEKETAHDCFVLLIEEVGEFARTLRKRTGLVRHQENSGHNESLELADILLYLVHMANILGVDLTDAVREKEEINFARFLRKKQG